MTEGQPQAKPVVSAVASQNGIFSTHSREIGDKK